MTGVAMPEIDRAPGPLKDVWIPPQVFTLRTGHVRFKCPLPECLQLKNYSRHDMGVVGVCAHQRNHDLQSFGNKHTLKLYIQWKLPFTRIKIFDLLEQLLIS